MSGSSPKIKRLDQTPLTILELARAYRDGSASPVEVIEVLLQRIEREDGNLRAFMHVNAIGAREAARSAEKALKSDASLGPLFGIPIVHKDNLHTCDAPTGAHSRLLSGQGGTFDADIVANLRGAGMILLGKTNLPEFSFGSADSRGYSRNPYDLSRYSGGSSGGTAAAVAAGFSPAGTGSDTTGSVRIPASMCGLVGVKPTAGRISRLGLLPLSLSFDQVGPIARTVSDARILLNAMEGVLHSRDASADWEQGSEEAKLEGLKIGVPTRHFFSELEPDVALSTSLALEKLEELGAILVPLRLELGDELLAAASVLTMTEAYSAHADSLRSRSLEYGERTRRRLLVGAQYTQADIHKASELRLAWVQEIERAFTAVDLIATPTVPFTAFPIELQESNPPDTSWATAPFSLTDCPAISVPCGFDNDGLPIGLQLVARPWGEGLMFRAARAYEIGRGISRGPIDTQ